MIDIAGMIRLVAKRVKRLGEKHNTPLRIRHTELLDAVASYAGLTNWHTARKTKQLPTGSPLAGADIDDAARSILTQLSGSAKPTPLLFLDEMSRIFSRKREEDVLRTTPGIPQQTYSLLEDGRVFVFERLLGMATGHPDRLKQIEANPAHYVRVASVSPRDAVTFWNITPHPFRIDQTDAGVHVVHDELLSRLPVTFETEDAARDAMCTLLAGGVIDGPGDYVYRGQPLVLCERFDISSLPPVPDLPPLPKHKGEPVHDVFDAEYVDGNPVLTHQMFSAIRDRVNAWNKEATVRTQFAYAHNGDVWKAVQQQNAPTSLSAAPIHRVYPELGFLPSDQVESLLDEYRDRQYIDVDEDEGASRDNWFVYFALESIALNGEKSGSLRNVGAQFAAFLLQGVPFEAAKQLAHEWATYDVALRTLSRRASCVMSYLRSDAHWTQGPRRYDLNDAFRDCRKTGEAKLTQVIQRLKM